MSACVYSPGQHDKEQHPELVRHQLDEEGTKDAIAEFGKRGTELVFLIVCNKLLTGFDAPIEQALYLDNPLTDHNLLQAIARTNRRYGHAKEHGEIVDYIGVSQKLSDALAKVAESPEYKKFLADQFAEPTSFEPSTKAGTFVADQLEDMKKATAGK